MIMHDKTTELVGKIGPWGNSKLYISTRKDIAPFFKLDVQKKPRIAFKNLMVQFQNDKLKMKEFGFKENENCCKFSLETDGLKLMVERSIMKGVKIDTGELLNETNMINLRTTKQNEPIPLVLKFVASDDLIKSLLDVLKHDGSGLFPLFNDVLRDEILNSHLGFIKIWLKTIKIFILR